LRALVGVLRRLVPAAAIAGSVFYLAFFVSQFSFLPGMAGDVAARILGVMDALAGDTPETLKLLGQWMAGGALTIAALGARFKRTFGRLRVALDAVLDVDNYFADPPDRQPPRARIFSRYASLLAYLRESDYRRIVVVAHSQGTVISADLLRYLHVQGRLARLVGNVPVALVTVGSPLRDLYAERFPLLYRWISARGTPFADAKPAAADLGAVEWVNACRSGDYVGRFIWTPDHDPAVFGFGVRRAGDRTEFCLGAGAHTHYFDNDAVALALEIDRLVGNRGQSPITKSGSEPELEIGL
jgi:hypothetical protein